MNKIVRIATRKSPLAWKQTEMVIAHLSPRFPEIRFEPLGITTTGDAQTQWSLEKMGGKGLFTKEIEQALLSGDADLAVHSAKDLPTEMVSRLTLCGCLPRHRANDLIITASGDSSAPGLIATSSPRRRIQGQGLFPKAKWTDIRGNLNTRLGKIANGLADATFLACAGIERLGIQLPAGLQSTLLPIDQMVPAAGQGAIAVQTRTDDAPLWAPHLHTPTLKAISLERAFLHALGGGCQTAIGIHCDGPNLHLFAQSCGYLKHTFRNNWQETLHAFQELTPLINQATPPTH